MISQQAALKTISPRPSARFVRIEVRRMDGGLSERLAWRRVLADLKRETIPRPPTNQVDTLNSGGAAVIVAIVVTVVIIGCGQTAGIPLSMRPGVDSRSIV